MQINYLANAKTHYNNATKAIEEITRDITKEDLYIAEMFEFSFDIVLQFSLLQLILLEEDINKEDIRVFCKASNYAQLLDYLSFTYKQNATWGCINVYSKEKLSDFLTDTESKINDFYNFYSDVVATADKYIVDRLNFCVGSVMFSLLHIDNSTEEDYNFIKKLKIFELIM